MYRIDRSQERRGLSKQKKIIFSEHLFDEKIIDILQFYEVIKY